MIDEEEEIMRFQKWYMEEMDRVRHARMFTFPVHSVSLLRKDGKFVDEEFADWVIAHNMQWSDSNLYIDDTVSSLSNCCRLKSDITQLYFNSIGGTALKVGSVKVSTINLARIALEVMDIMDDEEDKSKWEEHYLKLLRNNTRVDLQVLDRVRHIIQRNVEKGLLPNIQEDLMDLSYCYNTVGFIGFYETMKAFGYIDIDAFDNVNYNANSYRFGQRIFKTINEEIERFKHEQGITYMINLEQIPGESAADKLMQKDKLLYPDADIYDLPLYGNQFIPLGIKCKLDDRIHIAGTFDKVCSAGSILHVNIDAPFTSFEQAKKMVEYIADAGVTYFAFNRRIQVCEDGHAFYGEHCPECGKPKSGEFTRVAGFYTPVNQWAEKRREEFELRRWHNMSTDDPTINIDDAVCDLM